jgi:hypothetical protein
LSSVSQVFGSIRWLIVKAQKRKELSSPHPGWGIIEVVFAGALAGGF